MKQKTSLLLILLLLVLPSMVVLAQTSLPKAEFILATNKTELYSGECFILTADLLIDVTNTARLRFTDDLTLQLEDIKRQLSRLEGLKHQTLIANVPHSSYTRDERSFIKYKLIEIAICPSEAREIKIPSFDFRLLNINKEDKAELKLSSESFKIIVKSLPVGVKDKVCKTGNYFGVGEIYLNDFYETDSVLKTGDRIISEMRFSGKGHSLPLQLSIKDSSWFQLKYLGVERNDTIIFNTLRVRKSIFIELKLIKSGFVKLSDVFEYRFYNPKSGNVEVVSPNATFLIEHEEDFEFDEKDTPRAVIAVDLSESMLTCDYQPNRLSKAIGLANLSMSPDCNSQFIAFAGNVVWEMGCFMTPAISERIKRKGSVIGDLLFDAILALDYKRGSKIIVIGDGDEVLGAISATEAALFAKRLGIKIYCVGIGYSEEADFYNPRTGEKFRVMNAFNDGLLKSIANLTGGSYFFFEKNDDEQLLANKLREIIIN